ncbi:MAG: hypothetical protein ACKO14_11530 [Armatimonadota bacterium]
MSIRDILDAHELRALCNEIIPPCPDADGAASPAVQERLLTIYSLYRENDRESLQSLCDYAKRGEAQLHPYFPTFAETVMEAYWTSELGLSLVGFNVAQSSSS